ncbi:MAG: hypothetical protein GY720_24700 [bacterium]|nr:hypothetical protein [bacterium]
MKRDWARLIAVIGALIVVQSVLWECVRMKPTNNYFIEPWSYRGFESVHGVVVAVIGIALLATVLVVAGNFNTTSQNSIILVGAMVVVGWLIALVFTGGEDVTVDGSSIVGFLLSAGIAMTIQHSVRRMVESGRMSGGERLLKLLSGATGSLILVITIFVVSFVLGLILGDETTIPAHLAVLIVLLVMGVLMSVMKTASMSANRMLLAMAVVAGSAIGFSGAAMRSTLTRFQLETDPFIPGEYRDTQVTWGYFLANIGVALVFIGAVMLWARRRDIVSAQQRAAKQREAAEESARELAAAVG